MIAYKLFLAYCYVFFISYYVYRRKHSSFQIIRSDILVDIVAAVSTTVINIGFENIYFKEITHTLITVK